jgi:hypothetical protein
MRTAYDVSQLKASNTMLATGRGQPQSRSGLSLSAIRYALFPIHTHPEAVGSISDAGVAFSVHNSTKEIFHAYLYLVDSAHPISWPHGALPGR